MFQGKNGMKASTELREVITSTLKPMIQDWSDCILSNDVRIYGIRRYLRGAWLHFHVDRPNTHVLSAILQVCIHL